MTVQVSRFIPKRAKEALFTALWLLSVKALDMLLRRLNGSSFNIITVQSLKNFRKDYRIYTDLATTPGDSNLVWARKTSN